MDHIWTGPQAAQIASISYDTLDYWCKQGLVKASLQADKPHHRSFYTFSDIVTISAIKALRDNGISLQKIKLASDELWKRIGIKFEQGLQGGVIVVDHNQLLAVFYTIDEAVQIMSLLKGGQMLLPLDNIVADIERRLNLLFGELDRIAEINYAGRVKNG
jgi:DNA-binding transcriptional MerR regulator